MQKDLGYCELTDFVAFQFHLNVKLEWAVQGVEPPLYFHSFSKLAATDD